MVTACAVMPNVFADKPMDFEGTWIIFFLFNIYIYRTFSEYLMIFITKDSLQNLIANDF